MFIRNEIYNSKVKVRNNIADKTFMLITGEIKGGKTRTGTYLIHEVEEFNIEKMQERLYKINLLTCEQVDFVDFNNFIDTCYNRDHVYTEKDYRFFVYNYLKKRNVPNRVYLLSRFLPDNPFSDVSMCELLSEYVEIYYYLNIRSNHVLANTNIKSTNTGKNALPIKESLFQLYRPNDLAYERFLCMLEDENGIMNNSRSKNGLTQAAKNENDDGRDVATMISGHLGRQSNFICSIAQRIEDIVAHQRRLYQVVLETFKSEQIEYFNFEIGFLNRLMDRYRRKEFKRWSKKMKKCSKHYTKFEKHGNDHHFVKANDLFDKYNYYLIIDNHFKKILRKLNLFVRNLSKYLYIVQPTILHERSDNVGKESESIFRSSYNMNLFIPASSVYGYYDRYSFHDVRNIRNENATIPLCQLKPFKKNVMNKNELRKIDYTAVNKILDSSINSNQKSSTSLKKDTSLYEVKNVDFKDF